MYATGSRRTRRRTRSPKSRAPPAPSTRRGSACSAARSTPSTLASSTSASRRGVSTPAVSSSSTANASTSCSGEVASTSAGPRSGRLGFELLAALVGSERLRELVELSLENLVEIVGGVLDPVVGHPALGKVVRAHLLGALPLPHLGAA